MPSVTHAAPKRGTPPASRHAGSLAGRRGTIDTTATSISAVVSRRDEGPVKLFPDQVRPWRLWLVWGVGVAAYMLSVTNRTSLSAVGVDAAVRFEADASTLSMFAVIQLFVYPDAYPTHGIWAVVLLMLIAGGAGVLSVDEVLARRYGHSN